MSEVIKKAIQEELTEFDFMRGAEEYKCRWNTVTRWNREAIVSRGFLENVQYQLYKKCGRRVSRLKQFMKDAPKTIAHALNK